MRVFRGHSRPVPAPVVLAIGNFDGVHLGHAALLQRLAEIAGQSGLAPTVLSFEPHPREFFAPASAPARKPRPCAPRMSYWAFQLTMSAAMPSPPGWPSAPRQTMSGSSPCSPGYL